MASGNGWKLARAHASDDEDSTVRAGMGLGKALPNGGGIKLTTKNRQRRPDKKWLQQLPRTTVREGKRK